MSGQSFLSVLLLMTEVFKVESFKGIAILPLIYFVIAVIMFPKAGDILSNKFKNYIVDSKLIMPLAYIIAPMLYVFSIKKS